MLQLSATRTTDFQHPHTRAISLKLVERRALLRHTNTKPTSWWLSEAANVINWFVTSSLWHEYTCDIHWRMLKLTSLTLTALGNIWVVQTDTPKKQFSCYCSIKHLSAMRRRPQCITGRIFSCVACVWWVSTVPASAEFTLLDPFMCRGMVGMLWRQKYTHFNAWEQKRLTMALTPITGVVSCSFYYTKEKANLIG